MSYDKVTEPLLSLLFIEIIFCCKIAILRSKSSNFKIIAATEFTSTTFNGNPIGTFSAKKVSCTGAAGAEDPIEVIATGGTSFRYDSTSGQFVYNWQTPKGPGICYDTTFTAQDGSTLTANFKTK